MDTVRPKETQYQDNQNVIPLFGTPIPDETILAPCLVTSHSPSTGLLMTGSISGLTDWYEADKLCAEGTDWPGTRIKVDLMELIYLYLTNIYASPRTEENFQQFFDTVFGEDLEPVIDFESEKVAIIINVSQCQALLIAIGADEKNYDSARAAQPAFPPM